MAYALDCEMIAVSLPSSKKLKSIAARVSIVDSYGMVVIDEYCQPPYEVYSYNTDYSGITPDNLIGKMSYAELRSIVSSLIENRLIVGHDLKNDFRALDINHPREFRFDTANDRTLRELANLPIDKKPKLARLTYRLTAGLDYVTDCAPTRVTIRGSRPGQFNPFSSPTTDAEYRGSKNNFHVLINGVEPGFGLTSSSTSPIW
ncbi:unnamed protein product [Schistocephalus solidus]|uniref:Exonuclease domain-containing protein n=1 Tax=Schistocephalus solidus TaxID=70667 RepID=A0A183TL26_SCHSO|nr:unnamed protein product [Schistocephalus solidus]